MYIDTTYYTDTYMGSPVEPGELPRLIKRASEVIDQATGFKIAQSPNKLDDFPLFVQDQVKNATAAQVEYLVENGLEVNQGGGVSSVSAGNFSYSEKQNDKMSREAKRLSPAALSFLTYTGLLYTGVDVGESTSYT